jgi:hypothetical protein
MWHGFLLLLLLLLLLRVPGWLCQSHCHCWWQHLPLVLMVLEVASCSELGCLMLDSATGQQGSKWGEMCDVAQFWRRGQQPKRACPAKPVMAEDMATFQ